MANVVIRKTAISSMFNGSGTNGTMSGTVTNSLSTLFVLVSSAVSGNNATSVTFNGVALTQIASAINGTQRGTSLWYLHNPPVGTYTISVTLNTNSNRFDFAYGVVEGLDTTAAPTPTGVGSTTTATSVTGTLTAPQSDSFAIMANFNMYTAGSNSTLVNDGGITPMQTGNDAQAFYADNVPAGSFSMTQTSSSAPTNYIMAIFKKLGSGGNSNFLQFMA